MTEKREGPGRPPLYDEPLDRRVTFKVTEQRWAVLRVVAKKAGMSVSEYIRQLIETGVAK